MATTILDDINTLRHFAAEFPGGVSLGMLTSKGKAVLDAAVRVFSMAPNMGEPPALVVPEVARAELAALPVPRQLWDTVLEPLLAMAEQRTDAGLDEALQRLRSATARPGPVAACIAGLRAVEAVKPLCAMTERGTYEAAASVAGDAYRALRSIYHDLRERDRPGSWVEPVDDDLAWIRFLPKRIAANTTTLNELRKAAGYPETERELRLRLEGVATPLMTPERSALIEIRDIMQKHEPRWVDDDDGWADRVVSYVACWAGVLSELREETHAEDDQQLVEKLRSAFRARNLKASEALEQAMPGLARLREATAAATVETAIEQALECWEDRDRLAEAASKLVRCWDGEHRAHRFHEAEEQLRAVLAASPVGSALGKGGGRPSPAIFLTDEQMRELGGDRLTYSEELEHMRRKSAAFELLAWAEMMERRVAEALELHSTSMNDPALDDETSAVDLRARPGDRAKLISALRTGLACDVHVKNARGDVVEIHVLEQDEPDAVEVARVVSENVMAKAWDQHSEAICAALGPHYTGEAVGFDYDAMIDDIKKLRDHSEALQRLLSIHEAAWPHDVSVQAAKCVEVLAKSCTSSYCANHLMVAVGGSCPSCGPACVMPQQTPDPAQGA